MKEFDEANHNSIAAIDGDTSDSIVFKKVKPGQRVEFDACASSDPDNDSLIYHWWIYEEPGTYQTKIAIENEDAKKINLTIPEDAEGSELHLILEIQDQSEIVPMYDYRRVVLTVEK